MGNIRRQVSWVATFLAAAKLAAAVDLGTCNINIQARLDNNTLARNDSIFHFNGTTYMSQRGSIALTIAGCQANCPKPYFDLYSDMWPRLLTWLVPALLLVGSVHLPRIGTLNRLFVIFHYMGDPIDSMWSLLTKGEVWNRFYTLALQCTHDGPDQLPTAKALAAVFTAIEELTGDMETVQQEFNAIMSDTRAQLSRQDVDYILQETAEELVDSRSSEGLRTALVIVNYLWAVLAALVPEIGGVQSSQPGGRIGTAMFLSWLVTAVLLSNTLSGFTSRRTCLRIMERYTRTIKGRHRDLHIFPSSPRLLSIRRTATGTEQKRQDIFSAQPWTGTVYAYRPRKRLPPASTKTDRSPFYLLSLALLPVLLSSITAFVIIWYTPTIGLGCRTLWVLTLTIGLLVSPLLTFCISSLLQPKSAFYLTIVKDALFSAAGVSVILLSSIGIFNTCWCWSGVYSRGMARAFVDLDPQDERAYNLDHLYPAMVGACLVAQVVVFCVMRRVMKEGRGVMGRSEEERMKAYREIHGLDAIAGKQGVGRGGRRGRRESEGVPLLVLPGAAVGGDSPVWRPNTSGPPSPRVSGETGGRGTGLVGNLSDLEHGKVWSGRNMG